MISGYISRSVAGSYDNEAIAIFLLMFTFYLWIRALKEGSAFYGMLAALFYGWMVAAWGGYVFITNSAWHLPGNRRADPAQWSLCMRSSSSSWDASTTSFTSRIRLGTLSALLPPCRFLSSASCHCVLASTWRPSVSVSALCE